MVWVGCFGVVIAVLFLSRETTATSLSFYDCSGIHYITEDEKYYIRWNSENNERSKAVSRNCIVKFRAAGPFRDNIKICVKAMTWDIKNSTVSLKYYYSLSGVRFNIKKQYPSNSLSTWSPTDEWCGDSFVYLGVKLNINLHGNGPGEIVLMVYNDGVVKGWVIGVIVGSVLVFVSIIVTIIVVIVYRRRRGDGGTVLTNSTSGENVLVSQTAQQTQGPQNTGYSAPQNNGNEMNQPSNGGTTGRKSFNPPPYSSIIDNQQTKSFDPPTYSSINDDKTTQRFNPPPYSSINDNQKTRKQ